jgi:hypothetical protein
MLRKLFVVSVLPILTASGCCQSLHRIEVWKQQTFFTPPAQPVVATQNPCGAPTPTCAAPEVTCGVRETTCGVAEQGCAADLPPGAVITSISPETTTTSTMKPADSVTEPIPENVPVPLTEPTLGAPGSPEVGDRVLENP